MILVVLLTLMLFETVAFCGSALLHSGVSLFGHSEARGAVEAVTQGLIGLIIAASTVGIFLGKDWARPMALVIHIIAVVGAVLGMLATHGQSSDNALSAYNFARLAAMVTVLALLSLPRTRAALEVRRAARSPSPRG